MRIVGMHWEVSRETAKEYKEIYRLLRTHTYMTRSKARELVIRMFLVNCIDARTIANPLKKEGF